MAPDSDFSALQRLPRRIAHLFIRVYQLSLSALIGRHCRHEPTCSAYMDEAIQRHGVITGGWLGTKRLCRCHPWGTFGYDPVPEAVTPLSQRLFSKGRQADADHSFQCEAGTYHNCSGQNGTGKSLLP